MGTLDVEIPEGAYGVWYVPKLKVHLPVYFQGKETKQAVIDRGESALIDNWVNAYRIIDHFGSEGMEGKGIWNIQNVMPGAYAYMIKPDGKWMYECYMTGMVDVKTYGYMMCGRLVIPASSLDILNACCVGADSDRNFIAVFKRIKKI